MEEIRARETDNRMDYQREKQEVATDLDKIELNHLSDLKKVKDQVIDTEVETRKFKSDCERDQAVIEREEHEHSTKMGEA